MPIKVGNVAAALSIVTGLSLTAGLSSAGGAERKLHSHEHGVSTLKMAQEGNTIDLELEAPGDDIVGFEYAPKNDAQKTLVDEAIAKLRKPETLFAMPAGAQCSVTKSDAEFETSKDHAEFHVTWSLACKSIGEATSLIVNFFDAFPNAKEIEVEAVGQIGQVSAEVEKGTTSIDLAKAFGS